MPAFYRPKRDGQRGGGHRHPGGEADRGSASIGVIDAPYNFVPLSPHVFLPEWGLRVSHDIPFSDGLSGELYYTVQAETPLLVGGRQNGPIEIPRAPCGLSCFPTDGRPYRVPA